MAVCGLKLAAAKENRAVIRCHHEKTCATRMRTRTAAAAVKGRVRSKIDGKKKEEKPEENMLVLCDKSAHTLYQHQFINTRVH